MECLTTPCTPIYMLKTGNIIRSVESISQRITSIMTQFLSISDRHSSFIILLWIIFLLYCTMNHSDYWMASNHSFARFAKQMLLHCLLDSFITRLKRLVPKLLMWHKLMVIDELGKNTMEMIKLLLLTLRNTQSMSSLSTQSPMISTLRKLFFKRNAILWSPFCCNPRSLNPIKGRVYDWKCFI